MGKFPNHVAINKPIPSKLRFENGIRLKQTYANTYHPNRNKSRYNTIEDIGKKAILYWVKLKRWKKTLG
jgi:hypothetical protein